MRFNPVHLRRCGSILAALLLVVLLLLVPMGCREVVYGSDSLETLEFDFTDFDQIQADILFDLTIVQQPTHALSITLSRELLEYVGVSQQGSLLVLSLRPDVEYVNTTQRAEIGLPELTDLTLSGAVSAEVKDFTFERALDLDLGDAARLSFDGVTASEILAKLEDAARLDGDLKLVTGRFLLEDAARVDLTGSAGALVLNASDAARAELHDLTITDANVNISDVARAEVNVSGTLNLVATDASVLRYSGEPELGLVNVSGTASLRRG